MVEHWLVSLIREAQQRNPAIPGIITQIDDGGPSRADAIYKSLPLHAQGAFDRLGIDKQLLGLSSPEEIAAFAAGSLPEAPGTPANPKPGQKAIFVSDSLRGYRHRAFSVAGAALCGAVPAPADQLPHRGTVPGAKWPHSFTEPSALASRNCEACRLRDPNEGGAP